jgi:putative cardiolipin synthase
MHDKSFTADNQATIVGGRNVGDEYFGTTDGVVFADLDVLAVGPVVTEVAKDFDRYWNSASSYPVASLVPAAEIAQLDKLVSDARQVERDAATAAYMSALLDSTFVHNWNQKSLVPLWAATRMISDDPAKGLGTVAREALLLQEVLGIIGESAAQVDLVSPYFVPTSAGVDVLLALAKRGVKVRILTNALEATDVGRSRWVRKVAQDASSEDGIGLYEARRCHPT